MFMIIAFGGAIGLIASVIAVLGMSSEIRREDRTRVSIHHTPDSVPCAMTRRLSGLRVLDPPPAHLRRR
ncbi:hypothetical protein [Herbidospora mongoliensis]|uniref:hypothetical protein n=1 Tax=Herbidospora mongoliensis TaxID=688067 RepID=UPI00082E2890|nr:hypothetical protein [Herbidospora mongoliensis]